jgi:hypothetical protein
MRNTPQLAPLSSFKELWRKRDLLRMFFGAPPRHAVAGPGLRSVIPRGLPRGSSFIDNGKLIHGAEVCHRNDIPSPIITCFGFQRKQTSNNIHNILAFCSRKSNNGTGENYRQFRWLSNGYAIVSDIGLILPKI